MKRYISILFILFSFTAFSQTPDTLTPEKKARYKISRIRDNAVRAITPTDFRGALNGIADMAASRTPYVTLKELREGKADTARVVVIVDKYKSGTFVYDKDDISSPDDDGFVIVSGTRRYIRSANELSPSYFGAKMDGVSDDRLSFVNTLKVASIRKMPVVIEKPIFLDIQDDVTKPIIIDDNIHVITRGLGSITVNNKFIPAFVFPLSQNCVFDATIYYDGQYDASQYGYVEGSTTETKGRRFDNTTYKTFLTTQRGITFTGSYSPRALTYSSYWAMFALRGAKNIEFRNTKIISKGETPDKFVVWAFKLVRERSRNLTVDAANADTYTHCSNINFVNVELDGVLMGIQGGGKDITINNLVGKRYSDAQNADGSFVGGYNYDGLGNYWMSPPHLIYLNDENERLSILNVVDNGIQVGASKSRPTTSGYSHSLKVKGKNVSIIGYISHRPDGFADIINGSENVSIENVYTTFDSGIFPEGVDFPSLRFPSDDDGVENAFNYLRISNITMIDRNPAPKLFPIGRISRGYSVVMENMNVFLKDFMGNLCGLSVNGNNNDVSANITLENHTQSTEFVFQVNVNNAYGFLNAGKNNKYNLSYKGWRKITSDVNFANLKGRITLASASNPNNNLVHINDINNGLETFQNGSLKEEIWTRDVIVTAPASGSSIPLTINIPAGWSIRSVAAVTITAFTGTATSLTLGSTTGGSEYMADIPITVGTVFKDLTTLDTANGSNRAIRINAVGGTFNGIGSIKVVFKLQRTIQGS
jgi:hypothetical protein